MFVIHVWGRGKRRREEEKDLPLETLGGKVWLKGEEKLFLLNIDFKPLVTSQSLDTTVPVSRHLFVTLTLACCVHSFLTLVSMCVFQPWTCVQHRDSFCFSSGYMGFVQDLQRVSWVTLLSLHKHYQSPGTIEDRPCFLCVDFIHFLGILTSLLFLSSLTIISLESVQKHCIALLWPLVQLQQLFCQSPVLLIDVTPSQVSHCFVTFFEEKQLKTARLLIVIAPRSSFGEV